MIDTGCIGTHELNVFFDFSTLTDFQISHQQSAASFHGGLHANILMISACIKS